MIIFLQTVCVGVVLGIGFVWAANLLFKAKWFNNIIIPNKFIITLYKVSIIFFISNLISSFISPFNEASNMVFIYYHPLSLTLKATIYLLITHKILNNIKLNNNTQSCQIFVIITSVFMIFLYSFDWILPLWQNFNFNSIGIVMLPISVSMGISVIYLFNRKYIYENIEVLSTISKFVFASSTMLMYLLFTHILIITYADIPSEVILFKPWWNTGFLIYISITLFFIIPFSVLLFAKNRKKPKLISKVVISSFLGNSLFLFAIHFKNPDFYITYYLIAIAIIFAIYKVIIFTKRKTLNYETNNV